MREEEEGGGGDLLPPDGCGCPQNALAVNVWLLSQVIWTNQCQAERRPDLLIRLTTSCSLLRPGHRLSAALVNCSDPGSDDADVSEPSSHGAQ